MMELKVNVPEVRSYLNGIVKAPGKMFDIVRYNVQESVGKYMSYLMESELTFYLGRDRYERAGSGNINYRNGDYPRRFTLKGIGEITVDVPRDRAGKFKTSIIPKSQQYEDSIRED